MTSDGSEPTPEAVALFAREADALDDGELLDLAYARAPRPARLLAYLDVLRRRPGRRAQLAASLVCFDLARRGDALRELELTALLPTLQEVAATPSAVDELIGTSSTLRALWDALRAQFLTRDDDFDIDVVVAEAFASLEQRAGPIEVPLFDEVELADLADLLPTIEAHVDDDVVTMPRLALAPGFPGDDEEVARRFRQRLDQSIAIDGPQMFCAADKHALDRLEALRDMAEEHAAGSRAARSFVLSASLFLAAHRRRRPLFARRDARADRHLREALHAFVDADEPPADAFAWLLPFSASPEDVERVLAMLLDVIATLSRVLPPPPHGGTMADGPAAVPVSALHGAVDEWIAAGRAVPERLDADLHKGLLGWLRQRGVI